MRVASRESMNVLTTKPALVSMTISTPNILAYDCLAHLMGLMIHNCHTFPALQKEVILIVLSGDTWRTTRSIASDRNICE